LELWLAAASLPTADPLPNCSISQFLSTLPDYGRFFQLQLSIVASHQLAELVDSIDDWNREGNDHDRWTYIWESGIFQSKQSYQNIFGQAHASVPFHWLWNYRCQGKHKVFFWLLLNDQLNASNLNRSKRFNIPTISCVLCSHGIEETVRHLIFECEFA
jgi:hypothetical protein